MVLLFLFLSAKISHAAVSEPMGQAAEYYFQRHDYPQSLSLWLQTLKRRPDHWGAAIRVAELKLLLEGRVAARESLQKFLAGHPSLPMEGRRALREKWGVIQASFVTDEGQSLFLQAVPKIRRKDCAGALPLLNQALGFEKGGVRVLRERARCEKALEQWDRYYESLKAANESDPFSLDIAEAVMEAHIFNAHVDEALVVAKVFQDEMPRSHRYRTALAFALSETGREDLALSMLQSLLEENRSTSIHPIAYLAIGKILSKRVGVRAEAVGYLERFVAQLKIPDSTLVDGWDPFRTRDRLDEARRLMGP